jgi:hypothetical protein
MASKSKAAQAAGAAYAAKNNPYVQRIVEDDELRDNIRVAFESARDAYGRLTNGKAPQKALMEDKKLHKDLKKSAEALRDASTALREGPKRRRRGGLGRLIVLALVGGIIAVAVSEDLRNKVLDALFGAEEEFDYTSTTGPSSPSPSPVSSG